MEQQSLRAPRERDFLEELERQRQESGDAEAETGRDGGAAAAVLTPTTVRTVGDAAGPKRVPTYDADDLEIPSFLRRK